MMVVCKYFQQGNCRFGQYCRFEHINYGHRNKPIYNDGKNIALVVAEDVLAAERGGQWMLSCFGPFAEQPCIPGMEDVSPEEVRWMMYKAQAEGNADQVKIQFQQMCQDMKAKHEALKHPTTDTLAMLEKLQKTNQDKSSFAFASSSINTNNSNFGTSNVFGSNNTFGASNTFGANNASSSIFGNSAVFGGKPSFNSPSIFGGNATTQPGSIFANSQLTQSAFGAPQSGQTFGSPSVFGGQSTFGQPATFSSTASQQNLFSPAQTSQSSIFGGGTNSVFASPATPSTGIFAAASQTPAPAIFGQAAATPGFGQSSVFGNMNNFGTTPSAPQFGGQPNFSNTIAAAPSNTFMQQPSTTNVFGGAVAQNTAAPFGAVANSSLPFGNTFSQPNTLFTAPFASATTTAPSTSTSTFGSAQQQQTFGNVFSNPGTSQQSNVFGAAPFAVNSTVTIVDDSMYTDDNSLTAEEKSAFAADTFVLSKIPLLPPSQELR